MSIYSPICPARAVYRRIECLEARRDQLSAVACAIAGGTWLRRDILLRRLEELDQALILEAEQARDDLADATPATPEGAACQLIAALRDQRSGDDQMRVRARRLMDRSATFAMA